MNKKITEKKQEVSSFKTGKGVTNYKRPTYGT